MSTIKAGDVTIQISRDGVFAGSGRIENGSIRDCGAVWSDDADESEGIYETIEEAIASNSTQAKINGQTYTWDIELAS